jgi:hypothetical protein
VLLPIHKNASPDSPRDKLPTAAEDAVAVDVGEPPVVVAVAALAVEVFDDVEVALWLLIQVVGSVKAVLKSGKAVLNARSCPPKEPWSPAATKTFISIPTEGMMLV